MDGMRHGVGALHSVSLGVTYSGDWVMGKQHGKVGVNVLFRAYLFNSFILTGFVTSSIA